MVTMEPGANPVPFSVSVKPTEPAETVLGERLVSVSGVLTVLKFAKTSVSSDAVSVDGLVVPVRS
jgi:hypothetical protein